MELRAKESDICVKNISFCIVSGEADEEMKKSENSRGLSDEDKHDQPSEIISALDKGFSAMANLMTDEVDA